MKQLCTEPCVATSTPNSGSTNKPRPRIIKPSANNTNQPPSPDLAGPKPIRGKRKSLTGRVSSSPQQSPSMSARSAATSSIRTSPQGPQKSSPQVSVKNSPQGIRKSATSAVSAPRRSMTPEVSVAGPPVSTKPEMTRRSVPGTSVTSRVSQAAAGGKSPSASPRFSRPTQSTTRSSPRQPASPKPATVGGGKSPSSTAAAPSTEQKPKPLVREGTFTKEPSASVQSISVDQLTEVHDTGEETNSNLKERDVLASSSVSHSSTANDAAQEQISSASTQVSSPKSNLPDVSDENNGPVTSDINFPPDYIASLLLGDKGLGTSRLKSSGASRSVGNLMAINSSSQPTSPRSGPATPTVGRKSIDSQLTEIAAAASKKSTRNKISSLWHREKPSKSDASKNSSSVGSQPSSGVSDTNEKCRDGLGKSPRSFRKSFPLRKSKKTAEKGENEPQVTEEPRLMRSETFDKLDSDQNSTQQSPLGDNVRLAADGEPEITSPASTDASDILRSSLDNMNETADHTRGSKSSKGLGFFKRFSKESKDKPKEEKSGELSSKMEVSQTKKKGFSLWRRDHSASKKSKKKSGDGESDGVVKSATLPSDVSLKASLSSEMLSALRLPSSATTEALVSTASVRHVSDISATSTCGADLSSTVDAVKPSTKSSPPGASQTRSTEIALDSESDSPHRQRNCTSIVTTV